MASASVSGLSYAYGYDEIGNSTNWTANNLNEYAEFGYDADGNMLSDGVRTYTYDAANRLKTVSIDGVVIQTNFYDAKSRRVKKVTPEATHTYFYDGWNLIEERVAYTSGTTSTISYYWGKDLSGTLQDAGGVGGLLYLKRNDTIYVPFYDAYGNVMGYWDAQGNVVATYTYDAFGQLVASSGPMADVFAICYSTKYFDFETGLYYYGYRFYSPELLRWITRDPIGEEGGGNLYVFCINSSCCIVDFLGDIAVTDIPGIMDAKKWSVGAALMRHWLSLDSKAKTTPNETIVKMDWVLGFERAKKVYDKIFSEKQYVNKAARKEIVAMIKRTLKGAEGPFCPLNRSASQVENDYVNTRAVGSMFDPLDDMLAALGKFNLRVAVSGYVKGKCAFVTSVGVYVRDSYDFVGYQNLGYWNSHTNYAGKNFLKGDHVSNASFREHAAKTGKGADFLVYSDIKITTLQKVEKVVLSP